MAAFWIAYIAFMLCKLPCIMLMEKRVDITKPVM